MAKKNTTPTAFDNLLNSVYGNEGNMPETIDMDKQDCLPFGVYIYGQRQRTG